MFSHAILGSDDLAASQRFYEAMLRPLGVRRYWGGPADGMIGFHDPDEPPDPASGRRRSFWVLRPIDGAAATVGNGVNIGFSAGTRTAVDDAHAAALAHGGTCEGAPGLRPSYHPDWYSAYVRDPDGNKLCIVCQAASGQC
jgi:catechol 2,3-dioxygenase-like lactoylglutathione lyase family enzyme